MKKFIGLFSLFLVIALRAGAGAAEPGNAEWDKRLAAAKKEGRIAIFLYQRDNIEAAVKAFEARYPDIQVVAASTPAAETGPWLMAERRAGKYLWDVCICGPTTPFSVLYAAKALDSIKGALVLPEVVDETKWWEGKHHYMDPEGKHIFVFLGSVEVPNVYYNKKLVATRDLSSFWDLLNSKWRGKILALDPRQPGRQRVQGRILYHMSELGPTFLRRFFTEMNVTLSRDDRQAMDWLAAGKFSLCLFCGNIETARAQGLPVGDADPSMWKETPVLYSGSNGTLTLMNQAPHPNAARIFVNWLLSKEGQTTFQKIMNTPDVVMESMRTDISKDVIAPQNRRLPGVKYVILDTPERSDQAPVSQLLKEVIKN